VLWRLFLPSLILFCSHWLNIFFLFFFFLFLLLLFLLPLFTMELSLGSSLSWPVSALRAAVIAIEPVVLALGGGHEDLVGNGCELAIKVILVLTADECLEVVAGDQMANLKKDANGASTVAPLAINCEKFLLNPLCTLSMLPLTVATYTPNNCKLLHRV
jgi:hypothetical protein